MICPAMDTKVTPPSCAAACHAQYYQSETSLHWFLPLSVHTFSHCGDLPLWIARTRMWSRTGLLGVTAGEQWEWESVGREQ